MNTPFVKVYVKRSGRDISDMIEKFKYEQEVEKANMLELGIKIEFAIAAADDKDLVAGTTLVFCWGLLGEKVSKTHEANIMNNDTRYESRIITTIKALDKTVYLKKEKPIKVWKQKTVRQIVKEIADKYSLKLDMDSDIIGSPRDYEQIQMDDMAFLKDLAKRAGSRLHTYIEGDTLYFGKRGFHKEALYKFEYGIGNNVISFVPKAKDTDRTKDAEQTTYASGLDPKTKELLTQKTNVDNVQANPTLGDFTNKPSSYAYDANANPVSKQNPADGKFVKPLASFYGINEDNRIKMMPPTKSDLEEMKNRSNNDFSNAEEDGLTADLKVLGDPDYTNNNVATIGGMVAKVHSGNWYISKCVHEISPGSAYVVSMGLKRNGSNSPTSNSSGTATDKNASQGNNAFKKERVYKFDVNGNLIPESPPNFVEPRRDFYGVNTP